MRIINSMVHDNTTDTEDMDMNNTVYYNGRAMTAADAWFGKDDIHCVCVMCDHAFSYVKLDSGAIHTHCNICRYNVVGYAPILPTEETSMDTYTIRHGELVLCTGADEDMAITLSKKIDGITAEKETMDRAIPATRHDVYFSVPEYDAWAPEHINNVATRWFSGYTLTRANGVWEGKSEVAYVITVICEHESGAIVAALARELKEEFGQSSVLVTSTPVTMSLI